MSLSHLDSSSAYFKWLGSKGNSLALSRFLPQFLDESKLAGRKKLCFELLNKLKPAHKSRFRLIGLVIDEFITEEQELDKIDTEFNIKEAKMQCAWTVQLFLLQPDELRTRCFQCSSKNRLRHNDKVAS